MTDLGAHIRCTCGKPHYAWHNPMCRRHPISYDGAPCECCGASFSHLSKAQRRELLARDLQCSAEGCARLATTMLTVAGIAGHVHDCNDHTHTLREWCDVTSSGPIVDGKCPAKVCTGNVAVSTQEPTPL